MMHSGLVSPADGLVSPADGDEPPPPSPSTHHPASVTVAHKLARIGTMLRRERDPLAFGHLQRSLHLNPGASTVWKTLGHALAQDGRTAAAAAALGAAVASSDGSDLAARTGLATVLAQQGAASAALDELVAVRRAAGDGSSAALLMNDAFERLCRAIVPGHRLSALQNAQRVATWLRALKAVCPAQARVLDVSPMPVLAVLAAQRLDVQRPVLRVEGLPRSVTVELVKSIGLSCAMDAATASEGGTPAALLLLPAPRPDARAEALPPLSGVWEDAAGEARAANLIVADTDVHDLFGVNYLPQLERVRALAPGKALLLPHRIEVWVALVQSRDLMRLNQTSGTRGGLDLSSLNQFCHRSRAVPLHALPHALLTQPTLAFTLNVNEVPQPLARTRAPTASWAPATSPPRRRQRPLSLPAPW